MKHEHLIMKNLVFSVITICSIICLITIVRSSLSYASEFEYEGWLPYDECIPVFRAITDKLVLHKEPSSQSPIAKSINVKKEAIISTLYGVEGLPSHLKDAGIKNKKLINYDIVTDNSMVRVLKPGIIVAVGNGNFQGSSGEYKNKTFYFSAGDVVEYLVDTTSGGEEGCIVKFRGEVISIDMSCLDINNLNKILIRTSFPVIEWWVNFKTKDGTSLGWLKMDKNNKNNTQLKFSCAWWG